MRPKDQFKRRLRDLRISVTDRCNYRCPYCMPAEIFGDSYAFLPKAQICSFEEIERIARAAVSLGVRKLRVTGGEPLLRAPGSRCVLEGRDLQMELVARHVRDKVADACRTQELRRTVPHDDGVPTVLEPDDARGLVTPLAGHPMRPGIGGGFQVRVRRDDLVVACHVVCSSYMDVPACGHFPP